MDPISAVIDTAKVARQAGFSGASLVMAVAIAGAESRFKATATGDQHLQTNKWGPSVGLWQIRTLTPDYLQMEPVRDINKLYSPLANAKAAYAISKQGTDWSPWSTYANKAYQEFETIAKEAIDLIDDIKKKIPLIFLLLVLIVVTYTLYK